MSKMVNFVPNSIDFFSFRDVEYEEKLFGLDEKHLNLEMWPIPIIYV